MAKKGTRREAPPRAKGAARAEGARPGAPSGGRTGARGARAAAAPLRLEIDGPWHALFAGPARAGLEAALPEYLRGRRWFGGKARRIAAVRIVDAVPVATASGEARFLLLRVDYEEGAGELYALPVAFATGARAARLRDELPPGDLIALRAGGEEGLLFAADRDPAFARALLELVGEGGERAGSGGVLAGWPTRAFEGHAERAFAAEPRPMAAEQSNTSVRFGEAAILKLFRRTEPGPNPDLEVGTFLTDVASFRHTPPALGGLEYRPARGEPIALAIAQAFVPNRGDAWSMTLEEVARSFAAAGEAARAGAAAPPGPAAGSSSPLELAAAPLPAALAEAVGPYAALAELLGRRTAELHLALASRDEPASFAPERFTPEAHEALRRGVAGLLRRNLALLRERRSALRGASAGLADAVLARGGELAARVDAFAELPLSALRTRTHGDYHLGQVLWTGDDFVLIDFEGEPARPLAERRAKGSPLRDVAGMVRSLHYAAFQGLATWRAGAAARARGPAREAGERRATAWYLGASASYLRGWLDAAGRAPFVPADPAELRALLELFLLEKAVYELAYELNNRPDWVALPLRGIADLLGEEEEPVSPKKPTARGKGEGGAKERAPAGGKAPAPPAPAAAAPARAKAPAMASPAAPAPARAPAAPPQPEPQPARPAARPPPPAVIHAGGPTDHDLHLWSEGTNHRAYRSLGAHLGEVDGHRGASFAVWAPNAERVTVMGDFNGWSRDSHPLRPLGPSGVWQGFVPGITRGTTYKYRVTSRVGGYAVDKADPFGVHHETPPRTGSKVWDLEYAWGDGEWMRARAARNGLRSPMSIYEVHLGSWRRVPEDGNRSLSYREIAEPLADYCADMGFTHVELLPITEHPFYGSWGYQTTGYFAPTSRYGTPQDFMYLVDTLHRRGVGVILDWVPSHFPTDEHALAFFDGTHLYEHADPRQGLHKDWDSYIFNYGRNEVRSFLLSSAVYWLDVFHLDGLRVDAVASMLYLDYSRREGEWIPNRYGGRENLEAVSFLRKLNEVVFAEAPDAQTIAEESTAWPMVSRPTYLGGLGFGMKWDMGWMHDTLRYLRGDPVFRRYHHNELTFRGMYAFTENFVLSLSHDEVVHGKGSLLDKMWGFDRQKFAQLRLLYADQWAQPGKKLLFMGGEIAQGQEWSHERSLDWHLLGLELHEGVRSWVRDLNRLLRAEPALHARDFEPAGFEWVDANDAEASVLTWLRRGGPGDADVLVVLNFTPVPRPNYRVGVPRGGFWREVLNSDAPHYGGSGWGNFGGLEAAPVSVHGRPHSLVLTVPPFGAVFLKSEEG